MKRNTKVYLILLTVILLVAAITVAYCLHNQNQPSEEFRRSIEKADEQCPYSLGEGMGTADGIKLEDGYVVYYYTFRAENINIEMYRSHPDLTKKQIALSFFIQNGLGNNKGNQMLDALIENNCGMKHDVKTTEGEHFECKVTVDELKEIKKQYGPSPQDAMAELIRIQLEATKSSLPIEVEEGLFLTDYSIDDNYLTRTYTIDENIYEISELENAMGEMEEALLDMENLEGSDLAFYYLCKLSHIGLKNLFRGNISGKSFEIEISPEKIQEKIQLPTVYGMK